MQNADRIIIDYFMYLLISMVNGPSIPALHQLPIYILLYDKCYDNDVVNSIVPTSVLKYQLVS